MTIGELLFVILIGGFVSIAMILTIMRTFEPEKKCNTCCRHLNPDGEIYCSAISDNPTYMKVLFCRDKI